MIRAGMLAGVFVVGVAGAALAAPIPQAALDKDYETCLGGETAQENPQRAQYCACVSEGLSHWDDSTYVATATAAQGASAANPPEKLAELAKGCIAQVLK